MVARMAVLVKKVICSWNVKWWRVTVQRNEWKYFCTVELYKRHTDIFITNRLTTFQDQFIAIPWTIVFCFRPYDSYCVYDRRTRTDEKYTIDSGAELLAVLCICCCKFCFRKYFFSFHIKAFELKSHLNQNSYITFHMTNNNHFIALRIWANDNVNQYWKFVMKCGMLI